MYAPLALLTLTLTLHCCVADSPRPKLRGHDPAAGDLAAEVAQIKPATAARAAEIAAALVEPLRGLEAALKPWRVCLAQGTCDARKFLDQAESALLRILSAPELAGLRDWVREEFDEVRQTEGLAATGAAFPAVPRGRRGTIRRAVMAPPANPGLFDRVLAIIRRPGELAQHKDLLTRLCVRSGPVEGVQFKFWPRSEPAAVESGVSANWVPIYRGTYAYQVIPGAGHAKYKTIRCDPTKGGCPKVDLMKDNRPVFQCNLVTGFCDRYAEGEDRCGAG